MTMNGNSNIGRNTYERLKSKLLTHSPTELSTSEGISVGLGYKIMASKNYNDFRCRQQEYNRKAYNQRKGIEPIPIKKNVPPLGNGQPRMTNAGINESYDPNERVYGSPFRKDGDSAPRVIVPPYNPPKEQVVEVKPGSQLSETNDKAEDFRQLNNLVSIKKDGVDAFQYVDKTKLSNNRRFPRYFSQEEVEFIADMMRSGELDTELLGSLKRKYGRSMSLEAIFRVAAFDESQLSLLKEAYKEGEPIKLERRSHNRRNGGIKANANRKAKKANANRKAKNNAGNSLVSKVTTTQEPKATKVVETNSELQSEPQPSEHNQIVIPTADGKEVTISFTITIK